MHVFLSVTGGEASDVEFEQLLEWLSRERDLRGLVSGALQAPEPGMMGGLSDMVSVALAGGGAVSVLAASLKVWFAQPRREDVRIRIRNAQGDAVEIDAIRVVSAEAILTAFLNAGGNRSAREDD